MISIYGFVYVLGFVSLFIIFYDYLKKSNKNTELAYTATIYSIIFVLFFARIFYVLYYNPMHYLKDPIEIFFIWSGGLSFYGGFIGILLFLVLFSKKFELDFFALADRIALFSLPFLALGRIANHFNGDIVSINNYPVAIYLAIKNMLVFFFLLVLFYKKKLKPGIIFILMIFLYSLFRLLIEFFRIYERSFFGIGSGQWMNFAAIIISGYFLIKKLN